jgi:uncharacterized protein YndB with AHSA1/START domain
LTSASLELLAPRADIWSFLAEPYHLADWWPGITGVVPDRRGFAPGARWTVQTRTTNVLLGRRSGQTILLIREIDQLERWTWHLLASKLDVEVTLRSSGPDRTVVEVLTSSRRRALPAAAVRRLYDLCQTAASL